MNRLLQKKIQDLTQDFFILCGVLWLLVTVGLFSCFVLLVVLRTDFFCISVLRVALGPKVTLASCKSALNAPLVYSTDRSKAVVPVLVLLFVTLWFILRGDLF